MARIEAIFPCHLQLVHSEVRLVSAMDGKLLGFWPFKCIRRYKFLGNVFCIEAGRKAPTGEGMFEFISNECSEIYRVMDTIIRAKAGSTTMRRFASEKMQQHWVNQHNAVRKTKSNPSSQSNVHKTGGREHDYASPIEAPVSNSQSVNSPRQSPQSSFPERDLETDNNYDIMYPREPSPKDHTFDSKFCNPPENLNEEHGSYDRLQFEQSSAMGKAEDVQFQNDSVKKSSSSNSYDALVFGKHTHPGMTDDGLSSQQKTGNNNGSYDKLTFSRAPRLGRHEDSPLSSFDDGTYSDDQTNDLESRNTVIPGNFYNTLNHLQTSQPAASLQGNTYDSLNDTSNSSQPATNTYDLLGDKNPAPKPTTMDARNTYDLPHETLKPPNSGRTLHTTNSDLPQEKPMAPQRPPPRKKFVKSPEQDVLNKKPAPPIKPSRLPKPSLKPTLDEKDGKDAPKSSLQQDTLNNIIQSKAAKPTDNSDNTYAEVDHEYASIDYSKVSRSGSELSSGIYSEPCETESKVSTISFPRLTKPKLNPPKGIKNIFKKTHSAPKTKVTGDGEGNFTDELKKKLECKLKKSEDAKDGGPGTIPETNSNLSRLPQGENADDALYDEVITSTSTYSEPVVDTSEKDV